MELDCKVNGIWNAFHYSAIIFYGAYGLLCCFFYKPYCEHIYFRGNWKDFHNTDKIMEYMTIGAGECCIHMAIMNYFAYIFADPQKIDSSFTNYLEAYCIIQVLTWIKWTVTEFYYTYTKIEWVPIGCLHIFLCLCVLGMAIANYAEVKGKCL
tara:strand:- start:328 stop:786 length:459 start_codon:yes stop_codon:yes gene_type:complete